MIATGPRALWLSSDFLARLDRLEILSRKMLAGKLRGERIARHHGASVDWADFREYAPGDDVRFLDWNVYARLDRLLLKLFLAEEDFFLHLLLDSSASCDFGEPNKANYLRQVAAALSYIGLADRGWVTVTAMADGLRGSTDTLHGRSRVANLLKFLGKQDCAGRSDFAAACRQFARTSRRRGICVVLSDLLFREGLRDGLGLLNAAGHELFCIQVLSPQELNPAFDRDVQLADLETGASLDVTTAGLSQYQSNLNALCQNVAAEVGRIGGQYILSTTAMPFDRLVLDSLRRNGLLA